MLLFCQLCFWLRLQVVLPARRYSRIRLFDAWLSSIMVGRWVATVAEICFAAQWAIILHHWAR